jgi:hypothetical protein
MKLRNRLAARRMATADPGPRMSRRRRAFREARYGLLLLGLALCFRPDPAVGEKSGVAAVPSTAAIQNEEASIPVATDTGTSVMTSRDYQSYVKSMGHLPIMSKTYVFGRTIPQPKTDKFGHIRLSGAAPVSPTGIATQREQALVPVATDAGISLMAQRDYEIYVRSMGHLPVMSKAYVFGRTIPQPKTDKFGHIRLPEAPPAVPGVDQHK